MHFYGGFTVFVLSNGHLKKEKRKKYPHLVDIGREIVKKCRGIPLVLRTLGSLLFSKYETYEWKYIRDNEIWNTQDRSFILPALELSCTQMPYYLKDCFALFSLYPNDHVFDSFEVTYLWRALGLLPPPIRNQTLKYSAIQLLLELLSISFLQDFIDYGIGFTFKIHDSVHTCAEIVAWEECKRAPYSSEDRFPVFVRHLSFPENKELDKFPIKRSKKCEKHIVSKWWNWSQQ